MWKVGPYWLKETQAKWPDSQFEHASLVELRPIVNLKNTTDDNYVSQIITRYSSINKLKRVIAYCFRFVNNLLKNNFSSRSRLATQELNQARIFLANTVKKQELIY